MRYTFADLAAAAQAIDAVERMKAGLAEFAAAYLPPDDGVAEFLDVSGGGAFDVPAAEAIAYFQAKGLKPTFSYADMLGKAHDQAFTVAKMMDVDMLGQVRASLDAALATGTSFGEWRKEIAPILKAAGWWGEADMIDPATGQAVTAQLGSAWRLETIFRTNLQTAYAAGQWRQIQEQADVAPFLLYDAVDDFRTREAHRAWDGTVLPVSSPWWRTHYPPNGWNCRCGVIQLDADQMQSLGITPRGDPPEDGSYKWTNPRTGDVHTIPNGIDAGFDRNAGDALNGDMRRLLREKVAALPTDMQAAVAPALRRAFPTDTASGRWHRASFDNAPDWLREKILDQSAVTVETESKDGAFARGGWMVDMDGKRADRKNGQDIWRHEFGHIIDARMGGGGTYRSTADDFQTARADDAGKLTAAAGSGRKSRANAAKRAEVVEAYSNARERMIDGDRAGREGTLREMAAAAGLDFDALMTVVHDSTKIMEDGADIAGVGVSVRLARMIEALRLGDGEGFLRFATCKDAVEDSVTRGSYDKIAANFTLQSWVKDGSLSSLSDLIGSATRNRAANYHDGFSGHKNAYYKQAAFLAGTESFANLTALAGNPNPYWWELTRKLAPAMVTLFEGIMK